MMACSVRLVASGNNLGVDAVAALEQTEDNGLAARTAPAQTAYSAWAEVRLIGFEFAAQWRDGLTVLRLAGGAHANKWH